MTKNLFEGFPVERVLRGISKVFVVQLHTLNCSTGDFLPISWGRISVPFTIENSHLFSHYHVRFSQIKEKFLETTSTYERNNDPYQNDT